MYGPYIIDMTNPHQPEGVSSAQERRGPPQAPETEGERGRGPSAGMGDAHLLQELEAVASQLSVEIRREDLDGSRGGLFRLRGRTCILLDRELSVPERVDLMARALARLPLDDVFLRPVVRELLQGRGS